MTNKPLEIVFDTKGNEKQKLAASYWLDNETEEILYGGAKYGGKSYLGCSLIFGDALIYPETSYFIARNTLADLRKYTMPSVGEVFKHWGLKLTDYAKYNGQDNCYVLYNKSIVYFVDASWMPSDPEYQRLGSMQITRGWAEEIGEMHPLALVNLGLTLGRWKNVEYGLKKKFLMTCNPYKGYGYRTFYKPNKEGILPIRRKFIQAFPQDNKSGDQAYIEGLKNNPDKATRERLYFGNWEFDDDPSTMISIDAINDLFTNTLEKESKEKYLIVDCARFGADNTVFNFWKGLESYKIIKKNKRSLLETQEDIKDYAIKEKIPYSHILIDEDGMGGGVVDNVSGIKGFVANRTPTLDKSTGKPQNFRNFKSQCAYFLADKCNQHQIKISWQDEIAREELVADLEQLKVKNADKDGKKQIISKDEMKEHLGRSPDVGDTFIMRMYFELKQNDEVSVYEQKPYAPTSELESTGYNQQEFKPVEF